MSVIKLAVPTVQVALTKLEFIRLCQSAGGATQEMIVAAKTDPALAYMWLEFDMASGIERDDPGTVAGLGALDELGYLPNGADAVLDAWPMPTGYADIEPELPVLEWPE